MRGERDFAIVITLLFLLVTIPVMLHHEMWRDEMQAWLLARDSVSMRALFHALHYEGHPSLWYLILRPFARAVRDPRWMQPLAVALSACSVFVFVLFAPFSRLVRGLFAFGYFVVYGYTIVARSYGLGLTLVVVLCVLLTMRKPRYGWAAVVMVLLANTSVYGSMLVAACVLALFVDAVVTSATGTRRSARLRRVIVPVVVGGAGVLLAAIQVRPVPDDNFLGPQITGAAHVQEFSRAARPLVALNPIWRGYVPIPRLEETSDIWWANFLADRSRNGAILAGVLSIVGVVLLALLMRRSTFALTFYLSATCILILFSILVYGGSLYHHGYFFLAAIMALWFAARPYAEIPAHARNVAVSGPLRWLDRRAQLAIVTLLLLQVVGGAFRLVADYLVPFSEGQAAANYIRSHGLEKLAIAASPGFNAATVSAYLDRPIFALDRNMSTTFAPLNIRTQMLNDSQVLARVDACCASGDSATVLLLDHRLNATREELSVEPLIVLDDALVPERFFIYEVRRRP